MPKLPSNDEITRLTVHSHLIIPLILQLPSAETHIALSLHGSLEAFLRRMTTNFRLVVFGKDRKLRGCVLPLRSAHREIESRRQKKCEGHRSRRRAGQKKVESKLTPLTHHHPTPPILQLVSGQIINDKLFLIVSASNILNSLLNPNKLFSKPAEQGKCPLSVSLFTFCLYQNLWAAKLQTVQAINLP